MIKLKDILNEGKKFGSSVKFTDKGIPFADGLTPELKKEAEEYIKEKLKSQYNGEWKWKKWSGKDDPRIIKKGTKDAYLVGFSTCEASSKILGKKYPLGFDITWIPNSVSPVVEWTIDTLSYELDEDIIAPKLKKWFMEINPKEMPKTLKNGFISDIPKSFFGPFNSDVVLTYYTGGKPELGEGPYRVYEVFEVCHEKYYEEYKKLHPSFFQKVADTVKGMFKNEEVSQSIKLKNLINESFEKIYDKFDKKDYFGTNSYVKTNIGNWKRAKEKGDKGADDYTEASIEKIVRDNQKSMAKDNYNFIAKAIKNKDLKYLKSILRYDQHYAKAIFTDITGKQLPNTTKEISAFLDKWEDSLNESTTNPKIIVVTYIEQNGKLYSIKVDGKKVEDTEIKNKYSIMIPRYYDESSLDKIVNTFKKQGIKFTYNDSMDIS